MMFSDRRSVLCERGSAGVLLRRQLVGDSFGAHHGLFPSQVLAPLRDMLAMLV